MPSDFDHFEYCSKCHHLMVWHEFPNLFNWLIHKPRGKCKKCECKEFIHSHEHDVDLYRRCFGVVNE